MQPVNSSILIKWKIPAQSTMDHPPCCPSFCVQGCERHCTRGIHAETWLVPRDQLCCSPPDHLPHQRRENTGREQEGHTSGRQVQCHLLLKVRMVQLDGADSSRTTVLGILETFPRMIQQGLVLQNIKLTSSSHPSPHITSQGQKVFQEKTNCISTFTSAPTWHCFPNRLSGGCREQPGLFSALPVTTGI